MKKKTKKKIKGVIKKPWLVLVAVLIVWAFFAGLSASFILSRIKREAINFGGDIVTKVTKQVVRSKAVIEDIDTYNKLVISNVKINLSATGKNEVLACILTNNSKKNVSNIKIKAGYFGKNGELADEIEIENAVKTLAPKEEKKIVIVRKWSGEKSDSAKIAITDFNVLN